MGIQHHLSATFEIPRPPALAQREAALKSGTGPARRQPVWTFWARYDPRSRHFLGFALAVLAAYPLAFWIRFDGSVPENYFKLLLSSCPSVVGVKLIIVLVMGAHRPSGRVAGLVDLARAMETATVGSLAVLGLSTLHVAGFDHRLPRSILAIDWLATLLAHAAVRISGRMYRELYGPLLSAAKKRRALVLSASTAGAALVGEIRRRPQLGLHIVGVLDADPGLLGRTVHGVQVVGSPAHLERAVRRLRAEALLIPIPDVSPREVRDVVEACRELDVRVQVVPGFDALISGRLVVAPRDVEIQDLLCREPVQLDTSSIRHFIRGRAVLITGAAGSIGSEICRQLLSFDPAHMILLDHCENGLFFLERELRSLDHATKLTTMIASITDGPRLRRCFEQGRPDVVFHAAAHKHVPMMEAHPGEAVKNNALATRKLVDETLLAGCEAFVMISTDKAVRPSSVMGATKRLAEMYVQANSGRTACRLITVRFGNVLGSNGSVVPIFRQQIRSGGPVTVTHPEMTRYFMTIPEAAQLVLQAGAIGRGGEIYVLEMGRPVRILDFARDMLRLAGLEVGRDIEITFTGLRPGEKLHEELYQPGEQRLPTAHPKISAARALQVDLADIRARLDELALATGLPPLQVKAVLGKALPEYRPDFDGTPAPACPAEFTYEIGAVRLSQPVA